MRKCDFAGCGELISTTLMDKKTFEEWDVCEKHREKFVEIFNPEENKNPEENVKPKTIINPKEGEEKNGRSAKLKPRKR